MPASEKELTYASLLYYHAYGSELPPQSYRKQDIQYIIEQLQLKLKEGIDALHSHDVH